MLSSERSINSAVKSKTENQGYMFYEKWIVCSLRTFNIQGGVEKPQYETVSRRIGKFPRIVFVYLARLELHRTATVLYWS